MDRHTLSAPTLEFLLWVARQPRTYQATMEAWRSSCPRFTIWEDALAEGLVEVEPGRNLQQSRVRLTAEGLRSLPEQTAD